MSQKTIELSSNLNKTEEDSKITAPRLGSVTSVGRLGSASDISTIQLKGRTFSSNEALITINTRRVSSTKVLINDKGDLIAAPRKETNTIDLARRRASASSLPSIFEAPAPQGVVPLNAQEALDQAEKIEGSTGRIVEHQWTVEAVEENFKTSARTGLSTEEVQQLLIVCGKNELTPPESTPHWILFLLQFTGLLMVMLEITAVACIALFIAFPTTWSNLYTGVLLWIVIIITCYETYHAEASADKLMETFRALVPAAATVIRDGKPTQVDTTELVPGDVIKIKSGDKIPADCRVVQNSSLRVDQAMITGESEAVDIQLNAASVNPLEAKNLVFNGSLCVDGTCTAIVIRTGDATVIGKMVGLTGDAGGSQSTLKADITYFVQVLALFALLQAVFIFAVGCGQGVDPLQVFVQGFVVIMIGNVPQGLPTTVTTCLFIIAQRMTSKNVFVKKLDIVETLGSCTCICTDKTGTLTQNLMSVVNTWVVDMKMTDTEFHDLNGQQSTVNPEAESQQFLLAQVAALNSRVAMEQKKGSDTFEPAGDATELGIYKFTGKVILDRFSKNIEAYRSENPKKFEIPFNSANKWQMSIHQMQATGKELLLLKGAPDVLLKKCNRYMDKNMNTQPIDDRFKQLYEDSNAHFGSRAERVLGFAMKPMEKSIAEEQAINPEYLTDLKTRLVNKPKPGETIADPVTDLIFVGFLTLMDPPRLEVPQAVADCHRAGVKVVMVTGDHPNTAAAIARKIGLISGETRDEAAKRLGITDKRQVPREEFSAIVVHGQDEIPGMDDNDWDLLVKIPEVVFARTSPENKLTIVEKFTAAGNVTAMTGDGVNDSPALKKAHIGIAMGMNGSDVAREAADIVLLDDNFASIVVGIKEGRLLFSNLKKSVAYTLAHLVPEVIPVIIWSITGCPQPMGALLALCIDLLTDLTPAASIAYEEPEGNIMDVPPRNVKTDKLTTFPLLFYTYGIAGLILTGGCYFTYFMTFKHFGVSAHELFTNKNVYFTTTSTDIFYTSDGSGRSYSPNLQKHIVYMVQGAWYIQIVAGQACHLLTCRTTTISVFKHGLFKNWYSNASLIIAAGLGLFVTYVPGLQEIVQSGNPLSKYVAAATAMVFFAFWSSSEGRKLFSRTYPDCWLNRKVLGW